jgi:hypothetical protein
VVVPLSLLPELRKLPDDVLSFPKAVERVSTTTFRSKYLALQQTEWRTPRMFHHKDIIPIAVRRGCGFSLTIN